MQAQLMAPTHSSAPLPPAPYPADAPWPVMRGNPASTGAPWAALEPVLGTGLGVRRFRTGNGIFSTPVIGADERIYVGSADHHVYCFDPIAGEEVWRFKTGEIIDSAACLGPHGGLYVPSGDGSIYALDLEGKERWRFDLLGDRAGRVTTSTIFWWEGNVTLGPNGLLFAGNDDFYLYAIDPADGSVRWALPTGLHIWGAPAFGEGLVVVPSFDLKLYACDQDTGALRWTAALDNFVSSSPAVAEGQVFVGSFAGTVEGFSLADGRKTLSVDLGAPVYASPAISADGQLIVGALDGVISSIDLASGEVRWSYSTGDAVRGSAALGPDPEQRCDYLIYVPSGDGSVYALEPSGARRWSLDLTGGQDYPDINASVALGLRGLATATAGGEVLWIPYDHYLSNPLGLCVKPSDGLPVDGASLHLVSRGGRAASDSLGAEPVELEIEPHEPIRLRRRLQRAGRPVNARLEPSVVVEEGDYPHEVRIVPGERELVLVPRAELKAPATLRIQAGAATGRLRLVPRASAEGASELVGRRFRVRRMSIPAPAIVPTFDQIGIASLSIDVVVVEHDPKTGRVLAWGLQEFGIDEGGEQVGVPLTRTHRFAFGGRYEDGHLVLEAGPGQFEITAFALPTDRFRLAATLGPEGLPSVAPSLLLEASRPSLGELLPQLSSGGAVRWSELPALAWASLRTLPLLTRLLRGRLHRPWGLVDDEGQFVGVGTFRAAECPAREDAPFEVEAAWSSGRRRVALTIRGAQPGAIPGLLLVDQESGQPLPVDPNALRVSRDGQGRPTGATLAIPGPLREKELRAVVVSGLAVVGTFGLK